jgi:predicted phage tail protein
MAWGAQLLGCAHVPAWHEAAQQQTYHAAAVAAAIETAPAAVIAAVAGYAAYTAAVAAPCQSAAAVTGQQMLAPSCTCSRVESADITKQVGLWQQ